MILKINRELLPVGCEAVAIVNEVSSVGGSRPNNEATVICGARSVTLRDEVGEYTNPVRDEFRTDCAIAMGAMCLGCPNNSNKSTIVPPAV